LKSDWDPRDGTSRPSSYFILQPVRIDAWREVYEIPGRLIMRDAAWLD
jgi:hypothetical protein